MAVERCSRCDVYVDLDYCVEGIIYFGKDLIPICDSCMTEEEWEQHEAEEEE